MPIRVTMHMDGRVLRDEYFEPADERDVTKSLVRSVKSMMRAVAPSGESKEFRLTVTRFR